MINPFAQPAKSQTKTVSNPFASKLANQNGGNPFATATSSHPFGAKQRKRDGGDSNTSDTESKRKGKSFNNAPDTSVSNGTNTKHKHGEDKKKTVFTKKLPNGALSGPKKQPENARNANTFSSNVSTLSQPSSLGTNTTRTAFKPSQKSFASSIKSQDAHAQKVYTQLRKDGISPPSWPSQPGDPNNKAAMTKFRERYEDYRTNVRESLTKANLIDDPNQRRTLQNAIEFKGICQDMCPEFEKITRITELDVHQPEKDPKTNAPSTWRMVKKLARSAAGQEAPLPMDVRSVPTLKKTLDYLVDDLLRDDSNLPNLHNFLWDRTRAIRRDFAFFSSLTPDELRTQIYVLETIARFHVTSLHILSQKDIKPEDFVEQQELEQLGKTLLSLRDLYDDCTAQGITCDNEAEFRAYYLLFHAQDPNIIEVVQRQWKPQLWMESDHVRTAVSLVEAIQNTRDFHGPLKPGPSLVAGGPLLSYFRIVEDPEVSYTMACFAETHFAGLRRSILISICRALARPKGVTQDVSANDLNRYLRFDTVEEAIEFAELHDLEFDEDEDAPSDIGRQRLTLRHGQQLARPKLQHQFSHVLVEKKRGRRTLPALIHGSQSGTLQGINHMNNEADKGSLLISDSKTETPAPPVATIFAPKANSNPFSGFGAANNVAASPFATGPSAAATLNSKPATTTLPSAFDSQTTPLVPTSQLPNKALSNPFSTAFQPSSQPLPFNNTSTKITSDATNDKSTAEAPKPSSFSVFAQPNTKASELGTNPFLTTKSGTENGPQSQGSAPFAPIASSLGSNEAAKALMFPLSASTTMTSHQATTKPKVTSPLSHTEQTPASASSPFGFLPATTNSAALPSTAPSILQPTQTFGANNILPGPSPLAAASGEKKPAMHAPVFNFGQTASSGTGLLPTTSTHVAASSFPQATPAFTTPATSAPAPMPAPPVPVRDLMGDFTKWYVLGDGGLMEDFKVFMVEQLLVPLYDSFVEDYERKVQQEEDRQMKAEADEFRIHKLRCKFFGRWRRNAREKRQRFLRRSGRDQQREFFAARRRAEHAARQEAARKAAEEEARLAKVDRVAELRERLELRKATRRVAEQNLLDSRVLSGVRDEEEVAARIVADGVDYSVVGSVVSNSSRPSTPKPVKKESSKKRALRESLLGRKDDFRRSLPPLSSRSIASSKNNSSSTSTSNITSRASERWKLKAMGFTKMPDGSVLPEDIADDILYRGKIYPGLWQGGNKPSSSTATAGLRSSLLNSTASPRARASSYGATSIMSRYPSTIRGTPEKSIGVRIGSREPEPQPQRNMSPSSSSHKRKRLQDDDDDEGGDNNKNNQTLQPHKRTISDLVEMTNNVRKQHQEIRKMLEDMLEEDTAFFREESEKLRNSMRSSSRGGSMPWDG